MITTGPHSAGMGVKFYTGDMFPKEYKGTMFIARKGSWNRTKKFGYDVVNVTAVGGRQEREADAVPDRLHGPEGQHASGAGPPTSRS